MSTVMSEIVAKALVQAGVIHDLNHAERVVIELRSREPVRIYVQRLGGSELAELLPDLLVGAEVVEIG